MAGTWELARGGVDGVDDNCDVCDRDLGRYEGAPFYTGQLEMPVRESQIEWRCCAGWLCTLTSNACKDVDSAPVRSHIAQ